MVFGFQKQRSHLTLLKAARLIFTVGLAILKDHKKRYLSDRNSQR